MEYFLVVVEEGSITRAAARLHMSQPPLTMRLKAVESELGVALLSRHGRGVEATAAGRLFAERARRLLAEVTSATAAVRSVGQGISGVLSLSAGASIAPDLLATLLGELRAQAPDVSIDVTDGSDDGVRDRVIHGEADAGLIHLAPAASAQRGRSRSLDTAVASREPLVAVLRADHPAQDRERADIVLLTAEPLIVLSRAASPGLHEHLLAAWQTAGGDPERLHEAQSLTTALALVQAGLGVTMMPAAIGGLGWQQLRTVPLLQHHPAVETAILWRRDSTSPVLRRFLRIALATPEPDVLGPGHARVG